MASRIDTVLKHSVEEKSLHFLVLEEVETLEVTVLLHEHELVEGDTTLDTLILLLFEGEEVSDILGRRRGRSGRSTIGDT